MRGAAAAFDQEKIGGDNRNYGMAICFQRAPTGAGLTGRTNKQT
jgi:hypothetical protein